MKKEKYLEKRVLTLEKELEQVKTACRILSREFVQEEDKVFELEELVENLKGERNKVPDQVIQKVEGLKTVSIPFLGELGKKGEKN